MMDLDEVKKWLSGLPLSVLTEVLGVLEAELQERDLHFVADELEAARRMLNRRLYGPGQVPTA